MYYVRAAAAARAKRTERTKRNKIAGECKNAPSPSPCQLPAAWTCVYINIQSACSGKQASRQAGGQAAAGPSNCICSQYKWAYASQAASQPASPFAKSFGPVSQTLRQSATPAIHHLRPHMNSLHSPRPALFASACSRCCNPCAALSAVIQLSEPNKAIPSGS